VEGSSTSTVEASSTLFIGNKEGKLSSSGNAVVHRAIAKYLSIDDDGVTLIIATCRRKDTVSTDEEIAYFAGIAAAKIARQRNVDNPTGLLIAQVPKFFPGEELRAFRERKAKEAAVRARELQNRQEQARKTLSDAKAEDWEIALARETLNEKDGE
jgi:hypothetical protein